MLRMGGGKLYTVILVLFLVVNKAGAVCDQFECALTKKCIHLSRQCNGYHSCGKKDGIPDTSDERDCAEYACPDRFKCALTNKCIPLHWKCDGDYDCGETGDNSDLSDEQDCPGAVCDRFECALTKKCIRLSWQCDGENNCGKKDGIRDTSDERNCDSDLSKETSQPSTFGLPLGEQSTPSSSITDIENGNITMKCIENGAIACSDDTTWSACLSRLIESQPDCSEYDYYTVGHVKQNCSSTQTSCALSTTIIRATKSRHDTTWQCSSTKYDVDSISPSSDISITVSPRPSEDVESNIRIVKALHQSATLTISVWAYPPPVFTWFLAKNYTEWIKITDGILSDDKQSHLFIDRLERDDFGQYKVEVGNNIKPDYVQLFTIQEDMTDPNAGPSFALWIGAGCGGVCFLAILIAGLLIFYKRRRKGCVGSDAGILLILAVFLLFRNNGKGQDGELYETPGPRDGGCESPSYDTLQPQVTTERDAKSAGAQLEMDTYEIPDTAQGHSYNPLRDGNFEVLDPLRSCRAPLSSDRVKSSNEEDVYDEII